MQCGIETPNQVGHGNADTSPEFSGLDYAALFEAVGLLGKAWDRWPQERLQMHIVKLVCVNGRSTVYRRKYLECVIGFDHVDQKTMVDIR